MWLLISAVLAAALGCGAAAGGWIVMMLPAEQLLLFGLSSVLKSSRGQICQGGTHYPCISFYMFNRTVGTAQHECSLDTMGLVYAASCGCRRHAVL
jgi:hypothetical protein